MILKKLAYSLKAKKTSRCSIKAVAATILYCVMPANAAVIVHIEEIGSDVRISWDGTLDVNTTSARRDDGNTPNPFVAAAAFSDFKAVSSSGISNYSTDPTNPGYISSSFMGARAGGGTGFLEVSKFDDASSPVPTFGFSDDALRWNEVHVTLGIATAPEQLTFDKTRDNFLLKDTRLPAFKAPSTSVKIRAHSW